MANNDKNNKENFWQKIRSSAHMTLTCPPLIIYQPPMPIILTGTAIISRGLTGKELSKEIAKIASKTDKVI